MNVFYKMLSPAGMKEIPVRDGYAIVPDRADWMTLPAPYNDTNCKYVGIVEVRNPLDGSHDYAANHYVVYLDNPDYDQEYYDGVLDCICAIDPDFKKIRNDVVIPEYNDTHNHCLATDRLVSSGGRNGVRIQSFCVPLRLCYHPRVGTH